VLKWSEDKDKWLRSSRGVSFQEISDEIIFGNYIDILEHPTRPGQYIFIVKRKGYTWVVPFILEKDDTLFLKTAYPSRKFHKKYGGSDEKAD